MDRRRLQHLIIGLGLVLSLVIGYVIVRRAGGDGSPDYLVASTEIQIPCTDPLLIQPEEEAEDGQPHLSANPACGVLPQPQGSMGTTLTVTGQGFAPNTETEIWWEDHLGNEFRQRQAGEYVEILTDQNGGFQIDIIMPYLIYPPSETEEVIVWVLKAQQGETEEPSPPLDTSLIVEHGLISLIGWVFGVIAGGGLGYALAVLVRRLFAAKPGLRKLAILLPWRTVLMTLILPLGFPVLIVIWVGLGPEAGMISVGLGTFLLALAYTTSTLLQHWHPGSVATRLVAWARTLATATVVFEFFVGVFGGGGVGFAVVQYIQLLDYETGLKHCGALIFIMLAFDLLLGGIQYTVAMRVEERPPAVTPD